MRRHARQRGMSLVVAIFLVVVIASLSAFAVSVGNAQANSTNLQLQADRALAAARAGAEWGVYRARVQGLCPNPSAVVLPQGALRDFRVTVTCRRTGPHNEGALPPYFVYDIDSYAQWSIFGAANYSFRRVNARVIGP